jgi:hypothetical protein
MRHKNRKWLAMAAGGYLLAMGSAYRGAMAQRPTDGNIDHIEREGIRRLEDERAKTAAAGPKSNGETRLNAAGPAFCAARYDARYDATFRLESLKAETATAESSRGETSATKTSGTESLSTFPKGEASP